MTNNNCFEGCEFAPIEHNHITDKAITFPYDPQESFEEYQAFFKKKFAKFVELRLARLAK